MNNDIEEIDDEIPIINFVLTLPLLSQLYMHAAAIDVYAVELFPSLLSSVHALSV